MARTACSWDQWPVAAEPFGVEPASLWVLRGNERAMRFYARHGFQPDGAVKFHEPTATAEDRWVRRTRQP